MSKKKKELRKLVKEKKYDSALRTGSEILKQNPDETLNKFIEEQRKEHELSVLDIREYKDYIQAMKFIENHDRVICWQRNYIDQGGFNNAVALVGLNSEEIIRFLWKVLIRSDFTN